MMGLKQEIFDVLSSVQNFSFSGFDRVRAGSWNLVSCYSAKRKWYNMYNCTIHTYPEGSRGLFCSAGDRLDLKPNS
jgi:hypothetical protein